MAEQRSGEDLQRTAPQARQRERLADALRENLKRRKQQARARRSAGEDAQPPPLPIPSESPER